MPVTKDGLIKKVIRNLNALQNEHKLPVLFCYNSKDGIVSAGSANLVTKLKNEHKSEASDEEDSWIRAFETDQDAIDNGAQHEDTFHTCKG